jgi:hypothetical protein
MNEKFHASALDFMRYIFGLSSPDPGLRAQTDSRLPFRYDTVCTGNMLVVSTYYCRDERGRLFRRIPCFHDIYVDLAKRSICYGTLVQCSRRYEGLLLKVKGGSTNLPVECIVRPRNVRLLPFVKRHFLCRQNGRCSTGR